MTDGARALCRLCGTCSRFLAFPGTAVPGFHVPPLRGCRVARSRALVRRTNQIGCPTSPWFWEKWGFSVACRLHYRIFRKRTVEDLHGSGTDSSAASAALPPRTRASGAPWRSLAPPDSRGRLSQHEQKCRPVEAGRLVRRLRRGVILGLRVMKGRTLWSAWPNPGRACGLRDRRLRCRRLARAQRPSRWAFSCADAERCLRSRGAPVRRRADCGS